MCCRCIRGIEEDIKETQDHSVKLELCTCNSKCKVIVVAALNYATSHEGIRRHSGAAPQILNFETRYS